MVRNSDCIKEKIEVKQVALISYVIVGSGHRAEFYGRIAKTYPRLFRAIFLCRSVQKVEYMQVKTGMPATTSLEECIRFKPDFAVIAVDKESIARVGEEWINRGYPVLLETPAGASIKELCRLWELHERGARIAVCEQYHRYPALIDGLNKVANGAIGTPQSAYISLAHDYHAASIMRRALLTYGEPYVLRGKRFQSEVVETDSRQGAITDGRRALKNRDVVVATFASGKECIYDFCGVQYRSFIRSRHITVRGDKGEWNDNVIYCLDGTKPKREYLLPQIPEKYSALDTQYLVDMRKTWQPELNLDTRQDEFAIATMLLDMGKNEIYPLSEGLDDAYFWLLMEKAVSTPWTEIKSEPMPWNINKGNL